MKFFLHALFLLFSITSSLVFGLEKKDKCILVVGGAGYIGSHVNEKLYQNGYQTIVLDNLSQGYKETVEHGIFIQGDLGDEALLHTLFTNYKIDAVMHFAAFLDVGESVCDPLKYYLNNVAASLTLLKAMHAHGIHTFIFSSTAAIFGTPQKNLINEDHPKAPLSPYGHSKLMIETILQDMDRAYGMRFAALRYFNAAGADPEGKRKLYKKKQANLIPVILRHLQTGQGQITIFGTDYPTIDGTGVRDYIHIEDLATAHIAAMERLWEGGPSGFYNLGNSHGFTVREVILAAEKVTKRKACILEGPRREGDPAVSVADSTKAKKELGWTPMRSALEDMILDTWKAIQ